MYYSDASGIVRRRRVRAEGQGAGNAAHPRAVRPTSQTSVGRRSVNFAGFGAVRCRTAIHLFPEGLISWCRCEDIERPDF